MTLFEDIKKPYSKAGSGLAGKSPPLAERMRPLNLDEFVGQEHLVGEGMVIRNIIENDRPYSIIFWGPPGSGKTTLARIIAANTKSRFVAFSAVTSGIKQIKEIMQVAEHDLRTGGMRTILFVDEIHRFNRAQQDAFLPYVENGTIILMGATTENPSFEVNSALLSRTKTYILEKLSDDGILILLHRAIADRERGLGKFNIKTGENILKFIARASDGDSRIAYNILELAFNASVKSTGQKKISIDMATVENVIQKKALIYDKQGEEHYNLISALHKSLRGSDAHAAVYWTVRMLESGEDPMYIIRRMVRFASEDIGLADPRALQVAISAKQGFEFIGPPEGYLAMLQAVIYLALAPKSNSLYMTYKKALNDVNNYLSLPVPMHIRNAPTSLMKEAGYGKGYKYDHQFEGAVAWQSYLPEKLSGKKYYQPTDRGFEKDLVSRLEKIELLRKKNRDK